MISSLTPLLLLFELFLFVFDALGEDEVAFELPADELLFALPLLLLVLPLPEPDDPDDPPEDGFSLLVLLIIIYTLVNHLFIKLLHSRKN